MKTLIEIFDECQIKNVITTLLLKPERVVFLGSKNSMSDEKIKIIETFFESRGVKSALLFEKVEKFDFETITKRIAEITEKYPDSVFDITGGKEIAIAAVGKTLADKNIPMIQFDVKESRIVMCEKCNESFAKMHNEQISIDDIVFLNRGKVKNRLNTRDFDADFIKDIENAWNIAKKGCGNWNRQATTFGNFDKLSKTSDSLFVEADFNELKNTGKEIYINKKIISLLTEGGLICGFKEENGKISFSYKNENVHNLLTKAGNVLELYAYSLIKEERGMVGDYAVGVIVDWDGVDDSGAETSNEIDIMLVKGFTPVFISCKNGEVHKEALYELDSVADRFGGEYAEKVMLATYLSGNEEKREYLKMRAKDMGIKLISGIEEMTQEELKTELGKIVK